MNSNSITQFKLTVALKKENLKIVPFFNIDEFYTKIENFLDRCSLIIDDKIPNFNLILDKYKNNVNFIVISSKKYDNVALNLNENEEFEVLFERIKNYFINLNKEEVLG